MDPSQLPLDRMKAIDLIQILDESIPLPYLQPTINAAIKLDDEQIRRLCFAMGMRAVVNDLVEQLNEERRDGEEKPVEDPAEGLSHGPWPGLARILGTDGDIREIARGGWVDVEPHERMLAPGGEGRPLPGGPSVVQLGPGEPEDT
jgi:hypothetical protein